MSLLAGVRVLELATGVAGPYAGRILADLGAAVTKVEPAEGDVARTLGPFPNNVPDPERSGLFIYLNAGKRLVNTPTGEPFDIAIHSGQGATHLAPVRVSVTPFGTWGPYAAWQGNDLIAFHSSGFAYAFPSPQVDSPDLPPLNAPTYAAEFLAGQVAAAAALHGLLVQQQTGTASDVDVSMQEALAAANHSQFNRLSGGTARRTFSSIPTNSLVALLPCADPVPSQGPSGPRSWVAISPREEHQWSRWLEVMGNPPWASDPRFADRTSRDQNWPALYALLAEWSSTQQKMALFEAAQARRVACFPLGTASDLLESAQLSARGFFREIDGLTVPGPPYHLQLGSANGPMPSEAASQTGGGPLAGVRVIDFSWVLTGPICTRYLAALGADVIKIESRTRPDLSARDHSWEELNTGKRSITLNLKEPRGRALAQQLIGMSDVVVENFSSGVMERLELDYPRLAQLNPKLIMASSSAFGRAGPQRDLVAYGTLIQCYTGFAALSAYPGEPPRSSGGVWTDPLTAIFETALILAAIWRQRATGGGAYIDLSMAETTIAALPEPLLAWCLSGEVLEARGNRHPAYAPQGCYPALGEDAWLALSVQSDMQWRTVCSLLDREDLAGLTSTERAAQHDELDAAIAAWTSTRSAGDSAELLQQRGIPATPTLQPSELHCDRHLRERGFIAEIERLDGSGTFAGLGVPWLVDRRRPDVARRAPLPGEHNIPVLQGLVGLSPGEYAALERDHVIF